MDVYVNGADVSHLPIEGILGESDLLDDIIHVIDQDIREEMPPVATQRPYVEITEQPHPKALRFRYECEGRSAGSIPGVSTTAEHKTFPSIQVHGYRGRAVVVVSCVTKEGPDHKPHPHNLVGKEGCKKGVCTVEINSTTMSYTFNNLGIQCVKKKDVEEALRLRQEIRVDPYRTGFGHAKEPGSIDLNAVRLCFQVFLEGQQRGRFTEPLTPVVSDIIYDKKAMSDLIICRLSDCCAPVSGGKEIILLCEKVVKEDIKVRFFEKKGNITVWESYAEFSHSDVHKQVAISFRTPQYKPMDITDPVRVYVQLERPSDNTYSEARDFQFIPLDSVELRRKRQKLASSSNVFLPVAAPMRGQSPQGNVVSGNIPNLSQLDATGGHSASTSGLPRGLYSYHNAGGFQHMTKEEIKNEPGDSPNHNPSNQYQLQPMQQGMLNAQSTSPGPDRSPATLTPSPGLGGPISPLDPGNVTPTPPVYTTLGGTGGNLFGTFATNYGTNASPSQQQQQNPMFDTTLPGPSNGWVQPIALQSQNGTSQQSFNLGNFGSLPLTTGDVMLSMNTTNTIPTSSQPNAGPPSMGSDLNFINFDLTNLDPVFNSSEIRNVLGTLSTTELNRLEQVANMQTSGSYQQNSASNLKALLANQQQQQQQLQQQQQQQQLQGQPQTLPDRNDNNDEDLTDSFTKLSTNDLN
ncbi:transcription factor p65 isoform X3 [Anopheles maculipalpis]|uniref:transcription factor p65 isoform X3 n=1 Tax=Anopheles maculipalpis TaxID=1496333 RepID=UPI002158D09A|nr:transcription factor p65 isoform X3 [Anopheles maculipalpis]